jgi:hypothetical protein
MRPPGCLSRFCWSVFIAGRPLQAVNTAKLEFSNLKKGLLHFLIACFGLSEHWGLKSRSDWNVPSELMGLWPGLASTALERMFHSVRLAWSGKYFHTCRLLTVYFTVRKAACRRRFVTRHCRGYLPWHLKLRQIWLSGFECLCWR